jgi:hypothetical protein
MTTARIRQGDGPASVAATKAARRANTKTRKRQISRRTTLFLFTRHQSPLGYRDAREAKEGVFEIEGDFVRVGSSSSGSPKSCLISTAKRWRRRFPRAGRRLAAPTVFMSASPLIPGHDSRKVPKAVGSQTSGRARTWRTVDARNGAGFALSNFRSLRLLIWSTRYRSGPTFQNEAASGKSVQETRFYETRGCDLWVDGAKLAICERGEQRGQTSEFPTQSRR